MIPPQAEFRRRFLSTGALLTAVLAGGAVSAETVEAPLRMAGFEAYARNVDPGQALSGVAGPGHNAWVMISAALVLFMTLPGLALFYGGLVRKKNVLSIAAQCFGITGLVSILWWAFGYSLVFGKGFESSVFGGLEFAFLKGVGGAPNTDYSYWVSHSAYAMFQLMFAIITPAVIVGAVAERMKFKAVVAVVTLWMLVVYFPLTHMVWGVNGFMNGVWNPNASIRAIDFAGGLVVEMASGWSALILCLFLGPRLGYGKERIAPHSMVLCMVGAGMLWVGWYGFNAGSALAADGIAANAFMTTTIAAAVAAFVWGGIEQVFRGHASILGFCSGAVAGLVAITPASGFVTINGAVIIGAVTSVVSYLAVTKLKSVLKYDDALDVFGVHGVGGTLGMIFTGIFADKAYNPNLVGDVAVKNGLANLVENGGLWLEQLKAVGLTFALCTVGTAAVVFLVKQTIGLRPAPEIERQGLDINEHGEEGYFE